MLCPQTHWPVGDEGMILFNETPGLWSVLLRRLQVLPGKVQKASSRKDVSLSDFSKVELF